jgi:hypothetical protein
MLEDLENAHPGVPFPIKNGVTNPSMLTPHQLEPLRPAKRTKNSHHPPS